MSIPRRLVLFVEGSGDEEAVPVLVKRLIAEQNAWNDVFLDPKPFRVGPLVNIAGQHVVKWINYLLAANKRRNLGAVLLILDGDVRPMQGTPFCAAAGARALSEQARKAGGGALFSVATTFALQEYESWLLAGLESLAGKALPDGQPGIPTGTVPPPGNLEKAPRDAKG